MKAATLEAYRYPDCRFGKIWRWEVADDAVVVVWAKSGLDWCNRWRHYAVADGMVAWNGLV
jgi:hypothetical protein